MTAAEAGGRQLDVVLVTGDAYVDHPSWGVAAIGRWLEAHGLSVGVLAQPDWRSPDAFLALGRPRLFFGVTAGNMDTMVNRYTAGRRVRRTDAYSPGGRADRRPDRATIPYTSRLRQAWPGVPVVLGGIEASLRRFAHYDWWQDKVRGSILLDAKADLLVYGMGEHSVVEIARRLDRGLPIEACRDVRGTVHALGAREARPSGPEVVELPDLATCRSDPAALSRATVLLHRETNPACARTVVQAHGGRVVVQYPPARPLSTAELDQLHELPWSYAPHPTYRDPIPALETVAGSVIATRGCAGGCAFCALTLHQGKAVTSRSRASVVREVERMTRRPGFKGVVSDIGGPTANLYGMGCTSPAAGAVCRRTSCLYPERCRHFRVDHGPFLELLRQARELPGIRHVYVNSGIRHDLAVLDQRFVDELVAHHTQGQLSVAPEHAAPAALTAMRKPGVETFTRFLEAFGRAARRSGTERFLVPYFLCGHPGVGPEETIALARYMKEHRLKPRQVQTFVPTPGTVATAAWHAGTDPYSGEELAVARGDRERSRQRALLFWWDQEQWPQVREALLHWGRGDLIGRGARALVPPGAAFGAWQRRRG